MESSATSPSSAPTSNAGNGSRAPATGGGSWDAIVVGGGHNGLTTGAYLAKSGLRTLILERRPILGGACVTEEVWPGARVSRCSYVVSMLQPKVVADLELKRYGYEAYPLDPAYAAMTPDGPIIFHDDVVKTQESIARFSKQDAVNYGKFEELLFMAADFVRPMMIRQPPALGSKAPADVAGILKEDAEFRLNGKVEAAVSGDGPVILADLSPFDVPLVFTSQLAEFGVGRIADGGLSQSHGGEGSAPSGREPELRMASFPAGTQVSIVLANSAADLEPLKSQPRNPPPLIKSSLRSLYLSRCIPRICIGKLASALLTKTACTSLHCCQTQRLERWCPAQCRLAMRSQENATVATR